MHVVVASQSCGSLTLSEEGGGVLNKILDRKGITLYLLLANVTPFKWYFMFCLLNINKSLSQKVFVSLTQL